MWTMRFEGGEELARTLRSLPEAVTKTVVLKALRDGAEPIRHLAGLHAPRSPHAPHLADSMTISVASRVGTVQGGRWRDVDAGEYAVAVGPAKDFFYGMFQEWGTVHHGAQPFMRPAFDSGVPAGLGIIGQQLWAAIRARVPDVSTFGGRESLPLAA
jgi:HK97 gp10 family phage protein